MKPVGRASEPTPPRLAPNTRIGRYLIRGELGSGGMGVVYEAYDTALARPLALKWLRGALPGAEPPREARALAKLSHPNVVSFYGVVRFEQHTFIAMELIQGATLRKWANAKPRKLGEITSVMLQACRGLAAVHTAGLIHGDFKPDNVMVGVDGSARVIDFGIVSGSAFDTSTGMLTGQPGRPVPALGAPAYAAPEQLWFRTVGPSADQFSFCVVLWELVFGSAPFPPERLLELVRNGDPGEPVACRGPTTPDEWLVRIMRRGLALDPTARFPSLEALLSEFEGELASHAVEPRQSTE